ncbi:MAG: hypothetical protein HQK79_04340 [Desulfobacterales bacterium]|nr:hypothetical protein [Desulfobacterales bacterium]
MLYSLLLLIPLLLIGYLLKWNRDNGYEIYQWTNDAKAVSLILEANSKSEKYKKDFSYPYNMSIDYYIPVPMKLLSFLNNKIGSLEKTAFTFHTIIIFLYVFGWSFFSFIITRSVATSVIGIVMFIPIVHSIAGYSATACYPGHWTPRYLGNAIIPIFLILMFFSINTPSFLIYVFMISIFLFYIHPLLCIYTLLFIFIELILIREHLNWVYLFPVLIGSILFCFPYGRSILAKRYNESISSERKKRLNDIIISRFEFWPFKHSIFDPNFGRVSQITVCCIYILYLITLYSLPYKIISSQYFYYHSLANILISIPFISINEPFGFIILIFAGIGLFQLNEVLLPVISIALLCVCYIYRKRRYTHQWVIVLCNMFLLLLNLLISNTNPHELDSGIISWILLWSFTLFLISYLTVGVLFHWILPKYLNQYASLVEICSILSGIFYFLYFMALKGIQQIILLMSNSHNLIEWICGVICLTSLIYCAWRFKIGFVSSADTKDEIELFQWVKAYTEENALFHVITDLPPYHCPEDHERTTLAHNLRVVARRPITYSFKDGNISINSIEKAHEWMEKKQSIASVIKQRNDEAYFKQAKQYQADYLVIANSLLTNTDYNLYLLQKKFNKYSIYRI